MSYLPPSGPAPIFIGDFLINEDQALKEKLSNLQVTNPSGGQVINLPVFYGRPDTEERQRTYPHLTIDLVDIFIDNERQMRAPEVAYWHAPAGYEPIPEGTVYVNADRPMPWTLQYQITGYSRQPRHDRQIHAIFARMFPGAFGFLDMGAIDGTIRRCDLVVIVGRPSVDSAGKRLFQRVATVNVSSELNIYAMQVVAQVKSVDLVIEDYTNSSQFPPIVAPLATPRY